MAKITANGDVEVARIKTLGPSGYPYLWVMTKKGRILRRTTGAFGTGYSIWLRHWNGDLTEAALIQLAQTNKHEVVK